MIMLDTPFDTHDDRYRRDAGSETDAGRVISGDHPIIEETPPPTRRRLWPVVAAMVVVGGLSWWVLGGEDAPAVAPPVPVVTVAVPLQREITEWDEFIGRFEASRSVEVRPRVSGQVTAVHFTDGQYVQAGTALFTIDTRAYRANLAEAQARVASSSAALELARSNLARAQRLVEEDAVAANEIDRLRAEVRANEAAMAAAQAQVRLRSLDLEFATVRAPISGRISDRRIDAGNLVSGGSGESATLLTTINAVDQLHFSFEGSEALFLKARREGITASAPVEIRLADEAEYRWTGTLDFTDNQLDPQSGTIRARALVANPDGFLAPGLFGNMRMSTGGTTTALLVPDTAVQTDQTRKLLLVVGRDGKLAAREVALGPLVNGLRVIRSGITAADRVVIQGVQSAMPGQQVRTSQGRITAPAAAPSVAPPAAAAASATIAD